jgi:hypothetical protein
MSRWLTEMDREPTVGSLASVQFMCRDEEAVASPHRPGFVFFEQQRRRAAENG